MFRTLAKDLKVIFEKDPAARTKFEIILTYPGLHALWCYRIAHQLWNMGLKTFSRWISTSARFYTGIEIHPAAKIGEGFFIDHGMGVVIGETVKVGNNVMLYQGVTLGGISLEKGKRHPTVEDGVIIGAGAKVLGPITIGARCRIGANAVVVKSAPPDSVIIGVPGQIIVRSKISHKPLEEDQLPDAIGISLTSIIKRLENLEKDAIKEKVTALHPPVEGVWQGEDFSI